MLRPTLFLLAGMAGLALAPAAWAQTPKALGTFGQWTAFAAGGSSPTSCFVSSQPTKSEPKAAKRGDIFLLITFRKGADGKVAAANEVSVIAGYPYKDGSEATLASGGQSYKLFTQADGAWARDAETDAAIVAVLRKGAQATVKGTSQRGTNTTDTYSLKGLGQALDAATKACGL